MSVCQIIFTAVANVKNVSYLESIDTVCILSVVPVSEPESSWENLVRVAICNFSVRNEQVKQFVGKLTVSR